MLNGLTLNVSDAIYVFCINYKQFKCYVTPSKIAEEYNVLITSKTCAEPLTSLFLKLVPYSLS